LGARVLGGTFWQAGKSGKAQNVFSKELHGGIRDVEIAPSAIL